MNLVKIRKEAGLNQSQFWGSIGVTQSAGSRYETGRALPKPVKLLVDLVYVNSYNKSCDTIRKLRVSK